MPRHDDNAISDATVLIRAVDWDWVVSENGQERLSSGTFLDGSEEASCFLAAEVGGVDGFVRNILPDLEQQLGKTLRYATIPAAEVRIRNLWIYRKPEEYKNNPAHVVVCSSDGMSRSQYKKAARKLADSAVLHPEAEAEIGPPQHGQADDDRGE